MLDADGDRDRDVTPAGPVSFGWRLALWIAIAIRTAVSSCALRRRSGAITAPTSGRLPRGGRTLSG
jgi:hypothetical protein